MILGRRILLWGGGGKTTLSRALGQKLGLPVVELDALYWQPGWKESESDDFRRRVAETLTGHRDGWIVDGHYTSHLGGYVVERADTIIWIDLPWRTIFWRISTRAFARARDGRKICGDNVESWRHTFFSRKSLILWYIEQRLSGGHARSIARREQLIAEYGGNAQRLRIRHPRALDRFYRTQELPFPDSLG